MTGVAAVVRPDLAGAIGAFGGDIRTPRLVLRPVVLSDAEPMFRLFDDWEIVRWLARPVWPQQFEAFRDSLARLDTERAAGQSVLLAVLEADRIVGATGLTIAGGLVNLGYWIGRAHWGRGLMTEAAGAACDWIFTQTRETAIYSGVFEGNAASMRVQTKLGFIQIGTSVHYSTPRGQDLTHLDTKLTRTARRVAIEKGRR
jgi:RimJ/RimL family protein N-acetyltransferase